MGPGRPCPLDWPWGAAPSVGGSVGTIAGPDLPRGFPPGPGRGNGAVLRTLRVVGALTGLGAQRPVGRLPGGGPRFSRETGGKRARGESFSPLDSLLWFLGPCKGSSLFSAWPAALYLTPVTARPPAGRAGRGGFADGKGLTRIEFKNSTKKAPQIRACTWAPKQPNYRPAAPPNAKTSERQQAGHKKWGGAGGIPPRLFASGTGREPTSQVPTCGGPNGTTYR